MAAAALVGCALIAGGAASWRKGAARGEDGAVRVIGAAPARVPAPERTVPAAMPPTRAIVAAEPTDATGPAREIDPVPRYTAPDEPLTPAELAALPTMADPERPPVTRGMRSPEVEVP